MSDAYGTVMLPVTTVVGRGTNRPWRSPVRNVPASYPFAFAEVHCTDTPGVRPIVVPGLTHDGVDDRYLAELRASVEAVMPRPDAFAMELRVRAPSGMKRLATARWETVTGLLQMTGPAESIMRPASRFDTVSGAVGWATCEFEVCLGDYAWAGCTDECCVDPPTDAVIRCHSPAGRQDFPLTALTTAALDDVLNELEAAGGRAMSVRLELYLAPDDGRPYACAQWSNADRTLNVECPEAAVFEHAQGSRNALIGAVSFFAACCVEIASGAPGVQHHYDGIVDHDCAECVDDATGADWS